MLHFHKLPCVTSVAKARRMLVETELHIEMYDPEWTEFAAYASRDSQLTHANIPRADHAHPAQARLRGRVSRQRVHRD